MTTKRIASDKGRVSFRMRNLAKGAAYDVVVDGVSKTTTSAETVRSASGDVAVS